MSDAALQKGIELFNAGSYREALAIFERVVAAGGGDNARLCLQHAREAVAREERAPLPAGAAEALAAAARAGDPVRLARVARPLFAKAPPAAYRLWRDLWLKGAAASPADARSRSPWALALRSSRDWADHRDLDALAALARAARSRETAWARYLAAEILLRRLDLCAEAARQCRLARRASPWLWESALLEAESRWAAGAPASALLPALERLDAPVYSLGALRAWRGALKTWMGRAAQALADLDAAADEGNHDASCWRGAARAALGRWDEALADLDACLGRDPDDHEARVWQGETLWRLGRRDEARRALDRAAAQDALWAYAVRARLSLDEGRLDEARADAGRLLPAVYQDAPDEGRREDRGRRAHAPLALGAQELRARLDELLALAGGVRRSDAHLNRGWMAAAGLGPPRRSAPDERLAAWARAKGLPVSFPAPRAPVPERVLRALR